MSSHNNDELDAACSLVLHKWIDGLALSKPVRNFARDFSDGVLLAEIIAHFLPHYVSLGNFGHVNSVVLKRYNWETLQKLVLRHLRMQLSADQMSQLANSTPGIVEGVLLEVKARIEDAIQERRFRPSSRRSRSCMTSNSSSRIGSSLHLHQLDGHSTNICGTVNPHHTNAPGPSATSSNLNWRQIAKSSQRNKRGQVQNKTSPSHAQSATNNESKIMPKSASNSQTTMLYDPIELFTARDPSNSRIKSTPVLDDFTKDQLIEKLYVRIRHLENSMKQKDEKIRHLSSQNEKLLEIARHSSHKLLHNNLSNPDSASTSPLGNHCDSNTDLEDQLNGSDNNIAFRRYR